MTDEEIKQAVEEYFNEMLAKDADYFYHVTYSWIYDAEDWFRHKYSLPDWDESEDTPEEVEMFWKIAQKKKKELYDEKYSKQFALFEIGIITCDIEQINKTFKRIKHHFKKFNTYTEVVAYQFEELEKCLQLLDDIENGRVESLKDKEK